MLFLSKHLQVAAISTQYKAVEHLQALCNQMSTMNTTTDVATNYIIARLIALFLWLPVLPI